MNKPDLIARMQAGRQQLETVLNRVDNERMPLIVLYGKWSVKDLIGHFGFWENSVVGLLNALRTGRIPEPFPNVDLANARTVAESRKQSLGEVLRQEQTAYQKLFLLAQGATERELFASDHFPWTAGRQFAEFISENTYDHYAEHLPALNAWLTRIS